MKVAVTTLRRVFGGLAIAAGIAVSFANASAASMQCEATINCGGGSYTCECLGPQGICDEHDGVATCSCQSGTINCTCANGCDVLMD